MELESGALGEQRHKLAKKWDFGHNCRAANGKDSWISIYVVGFANTCLDSSFRQDPTLLGPAILAGKNGFFL